MLLENIINHFRNFKTSAFYTILTLCLLTTPTLEASKVTQRTLEPRAFSQQQYRVDKLNKVSDRVEELFSFSKQWYSDENPKTHKDLISLIRNWKNPNPCRECIEISNFHPDAEGNDCSNLNDEYVDFWNSCDYGCNLAGWTVSDEAGHIYTFSDFILQASAEVRLRSGNGTDTNEEKFWRNHGTVTGCGAIWNNDHDTLYLIDSTGNLVLMYTY